MVISLKRRMNRITVFFCIHFGVTSLLLNGELKGEMCIDRVCKFKMDVEFYQTMKYRYTKDGGLYRVFFDGTNFWTNVSNGNSIKTIQVFPNETIIADGVERDVLVINKQLPGPTLEVMEGSEVC